MDIVPSSRAYFAMPSPTPSEKISLVASSTVYTYHCLCTHLLLATTTPLPSLPTRAHSPDAAHIMPLPPPPTPASLAPTRRGSSSTLPPPPTDHYGLLFSTRFDAAPAIVTSNDGFEKRYLQRCGRCGLVVGYQLDWQQFAAESAEADQKQKHQTGRREDMVYLLPGGFVTTSEMIMGKAPERAAVEIVPAKKGVEV